MKENLISEIRIFFISWYHFDRKKVNYMIFLFLILEKLECMFKFLYE